LGETKEAAKRGLWFTNKKKKKKKKKKDEQTQTQTFPASQKKTTLITAWQSFQKNFLEMEKIVV